MRRAYLSPNSFFPTRPTTGAVTNHYLPPVAAIFGLWLKKQKDRSDRFCHRLGQDLPQADEEVVRPNQISVPERDICERTGRWVRPGASVPPMISNGFVSSQNWRCRRFHQCLGSDRAASGPRGRWRRDPDGDRDAAGAVS